MGRWRRKVRRELAEQRVTVRHLRELDAERNRLVAVASHELRTPLTAILGLAKTLQQPGFGEDAELRQELLARIVRQGDRLLRMTEELLRAARTEEGSPSLQPEDLDRIVAAIAEQGTEPPAPRARAG